MSDQSAQGPDATAEPKKLDDRENADEQIAFDFPRLLGDQTTDVAAFAQRNPLDVRQHVLDAELFATVPLQERRELSSVQMVGIVRKSLVLGRRDLLWA